MRNHLKLRQIAAATALCSAALSLPGMAGATVLDVYNGPEITQTQKDDQRACLNVGDAISCSAGMLNAITGRTATNQTDGTGTKWGYVLASPQGALKNRIVVGTGGNAATDNGDINPTPDSRVEDGFKSNNAGDKFAATGKTGNSAGNLADPANNSLNPNWDRTGTWDVSIDWLIQALTIDSVRRELMIGFDYNQTKNATSSLNYWAEISVLDYEGTSSAINRQVTYEIKDTDINHPGKTNTEAVQDFTSGKTFDSQPDATDFGTVRVKTCYKVDGGGNVIDVQPITSGQCPSGYETVNNAQGDNSTEILAFLPELNASLEAYRDQGYDTVSVRMLFGCFGGTDPKSGQGYLNSGTTTQCDGGGNVDVYLLANAPLKSPPIPEPGTIALTGLALAGLGWASRRRKTA